MKELSRRSARILTFLLGPLGYFIVSRRLFMSAVYLVLMMVPFVNIAAYGFMVYSAGVRAEERNWGFAWRKRYVMCQKCASVNLLAHKHCTGCGQSLRDVCLGCGSGMLVSQRCCPSCGFARPGLIKHVTKRLVGGYGKKVPAKQASILEYNDGLVGQVEV